MSKTSTQIKIGDKVKVLDPGLARLRAIMKQITGKEIPNHLGIAQEINDDGYIMVQFPIGDDDPSEHSQIAPYPTDMVVRRERNEQ